MIVPSIMVADGGWHDIAISFTADNITLWSDHDSVLTYSNPTHKPVTTDGIIYLGKGSVQHNNLFIDYNRSILNYSSSQSFIVIYLATGSRHMI